MDHFNYKNNKLHAENVDLEKLSKQLNAPFYCYSTATLERHYSVFADSFKDRDALICYAVKASSNLGVIKTLASLGAGADVVSQGEIMRAKKVGIPGKKIIFSGIGKTKEEMAYALKEKILQFNVESEPELYALDEVARSLNVKANIAVRVNPDVDGKTHKKITTGIYTSKFGIEWERIGQIYKIASKLKNIKITGVSTHIGSQITEGEPFRKAFRKLVELVGALRSDGYNIDILDLGGGLGVPYDEETPPSPAEYAKIAREETKKLDCRLAFEPGRVIAGNAGVLVTKVIFVKDNGVKKFIIVDAGMNDLIRPSFYDAFHKIIPVKKTNAKQDVYDVVGPVCETGDVFAFDRKLPAVKTGDLLAIRTAGAYGAAMSSNYNSRPLIAEVMVNKNRFSIVRKTQSYKQLMENETIPDWL